MNMVFVPVWMLILWSVGSGAEKSWRCSAGGVYGGGILHHLPHPSCLPDPGNTHTLTHIVQMGV